MKENIAIYYNANDAIFGVDEVEFEVFQFDETDFPPNPGEEFSPFDIAEENTKNKLTDNFILLDPNGLKRLKAALEGIGNKVMADIVFTPEQDKVYGNTLAYYLEEGKAELEAEHLALEEMKKEFPGLAKPLNEGRKISLEVKGERLTK